MPAASLDRLVPASVALTGYLLLASVPASAQDARRFYGSGHTIHGDWQAEGRVLRARWTPGQRVHLEVDLRLADTHLASLAQAGIKADRLCLLATAERTFDADGWMRLASDERMSTLLTPTGLAIEGGVQGAVTTRYGYQFKSPFDQLVTLAASATEPGPDPGTRVAHFVTSASLPKDLPPGLYRLRLDLGVMAGTRVSNINGYAFAARPGTPEAGTSTYFYSPIIPVSGFHVSGREVEAATIQARCPWLLMAGYNSNGYRGVVADEDRHRFATSDRSLIPDEVILPMYDGNGARLGYSLEPQFPADTIDSRQNIAWNWSSGALSVRIAGPDGSLVDLGTVPFAGRSGNGPTTKRAAVTSWKPHAYGRYTVTATGWILDEHGRRYEGGGTYRFWIAKRMTLATATFQGQPYPVGSRYGRDIQFNPALPAEIDVKAALYVNSDVNAVRTLTYRGTASPTGIFGAAQGMQAFPLDAPGEYHAHVLATYTDLEGHLWVCSMRHAGVVYPESPPVVARGKKFQVQGKYVERGETRFEGYVGPDGDQHLAHLTFPYQAGNMLLIAAEGQGANKIEPVLTYQMQGDTSPWDTKLNGVGTTNLRIRTSNGYSPHLFPEYITDIEYYYGAAPRPGFMGRFLVGESTVRAPYWPVSPNSFGGQIAASPNGDAPGDIYRLIGGVVLRRVGQAPMYAGYMASAFLLPKGTNNNRVVAPGSEDLQGPTGERARFFLVGLRPGTAYEVGSTFRPAVQIDPLLPVSIRFVLTYPDGRQQIAEGTGDAAGSFAGSTAWPLDVPGVYRYQLRGTWAGHEGRMPGLPDEGGVFYVYSRTRPAGSAALRIDGASQRTFSATTGALITGTSSAAVVHYALLTPGAVIEQGEIPVRGGRFQYQFDPVSVNRRAPIYDIVSITTGKPQIGRVIHLTFFAEEQGPAGRYFDIARVVLRGTTLLAARALLPTTMATLPSVGGSVAGAVLTQPELVAERNVPGTVTPHAVRSIAALEPDVVRAWDAEIDRMLRAGTLRVRAVEPDTVVADRVHERLQQVHRDVPVLGGEITRQIQEGVTVSVFGRLHAGVSVDPSPQLSAHEAEASLTGGSRPQARLAGDPVLVVLPLESGTCRLAWRAEVRTGIDVRTTLVDAENGKVLLDYSTLRTAVPFRPIGLAGNHERTLEAIRDGPQVLDGNTAGGETARTGDESPLLHADAAVAAARRHVAAIDAYLRQTFGRRGLDGRESPVTVLVHPVRREAWGVLSPAYRPLFAGGFWDGRMVVLGEGLPANERLDGQQWDNAALALDLVAHELAHGLLDSSSRLDSRGEAGALGEAFSDIVGTGAEFMAQPSTAEYLIGEDAVSGGGLRSLENPAACRHADHVTRYTAPSGDHDVVHANSTIVSHAWYLAIEGGTNQTSGLPVRGVGHENRLQIEKAFFRAFVYLLPSDATFRMARAATIQSARDLFGPGSDPERAITEAWNAAGIR